jgi:hypothetical protein
MLSTFPFDPCSREKTLVYRGVPELFGIYELVLLTPPASSSSGTRRFPLLRRSCHRRSPSIPRPERHLQLQHTSTRHFPSVPTASLSFPGRTRARHAIPEPPPAATSSPSWTARYNALTSSLSRAAAPHQHIRAVLLLPVSNFQKPSYIPPPSSRSSPAVHHPPVDSSHRTSSTPTNSRTSFPVTYSCSTTP